jgi:hypothetical protein
MLARRAASVLLILLLTSTAAWAQHSSASGLRGKIPDLFRFGDCPDPLCLNSAVNSASGHGNHYIGATVAGTNNLLGFLSGAIATAVASVPISSATTGVSFAFVGGAPVETPSSAGPIFGERVQTLGRGRFLMGVNVTGVDFKSVRGAPLDNLAFTFTHQNVCRSNPAWKPGGSCPAPTAGDTAFGSPVVENDVIEVNTSIDLSLQVASLYLTFGVLDRVDIGVALPLVRADMRGGSVARVVPFSNPTPHFFGTASDPVLTAASGSSGTATGIGDVAARVKVNLGGSERAAFGLLTEARFPTGNENDFLGTGEFALRVLGVASARYGNFSPHLNLGYLYRSGSSITDAVLTTVGFDQLVASWATLAVDVIGQWQVGTNPLVLPGTVTWSVPYQRQVKPTNIPNRNDSLLDGSFGFKLAAGHGVTIVTNALVPLNEGGLRGNLAWTTGLEYRF